MTDITHRVIETNGIRMHIAEAGSGPLVLLLHGFPEPWYSWRHQLTVLAQAGYHTVAPDQRGYGQTDRPTEVDQYTQLHLVGDIIGLLDALQEKQAVIIGHDLGAVVAWNAALMRPDRVRGVAGLSVPYIPRGPVDFLTAMCSMLSERFFMAYFQQPGVAEAEFERDVRKTIRTFLYSASGDVPPDKIPPHWIVPQAGGLLDIMLAPETLPAWLTEHDIDYYSSELERTGFSGMLNWFRTLRKSWELMAPWAGAQLYTPALFIIGERDSFLNYPGSQDLVANLNAFTPQLREPLLLPGCGHWVHQERSAKVNAALIAFLGEVAPVGEAPAAAALEKR